MTSEQQPMTQDGKNARAEYLRQWRQRNKEKCRSYQTRYWERKAREQAGEAPYASDTIKKE